jgi:hypothetical protein
MSYNAYNIKTMTYVHLANPSVYRSVWISAIPLIDLISGENISAHADRGPRSQVCSSRPSAQPPINVSKKTLKDHEKP